MMRILLLIAASPMLAVRQNVLSVRQNAGGGDPMSGVENFRTWSIAKKNCVDCGKTIGDLFMGIYQAGFMKSSEWKGRTLTVTLTKKYLYGQVAMKSRLPVMWKLDEEIQFIFLKDNNGEREVKVKGMGMAPKPHGLELYEKAMKYSNLNPAKCVDDDCILTEEDAVGKYLKEQWKNLKKQDGVLIEMLKSSYDKSSTYYTVRALGKQRWGEVFYAFITNAPITLTSFIFNDGKMGATYKVVDEAPYTKYHLPEKMAVTLGNILRFGSTELGLAKKFARSSANFARMMTYGQSNDIKKCGDVDAIANLFTWCEGTKPNEKPQCSGKMKGRIGWTPSPHK